MCVYLYMYLYVYTYNVIKKMMEYPTPLIANIWLKILKDCLGR